MEVNEPTNKQILTALVIEAIERINSGRPEQAREVLQNLLQRIELLKDGVS